LEARPGVRLPPGASVFLAGSSGEPAGLAKAVFASAGLRITTSFVPGINELTPEMIGPGTSVSGPFMHPKLTLAQRAGSFRHLPLSYAGMLKFLREGPAFDICVVQVSPPDDAGMCSLGPAAEFLPTVLRHSHAVYAVVNRLVPRPPVAPALRLADCAAVYESDAPLVGFDPGEPDDVAARIAAHVVALIGDGALLQIGLGKVPQAVMARLRDRRRLRFHTGLLTDGFMDLAASGALDAAWAHVTTVALGRPDFYDWLRQGNVAIRGAEHTHGPGVLAALEGLIAVNSALEVDLFGQCNLEIAGGRAVSGAGGATDFSRAARMSPGGISIVALPARFGAGQSRIVPRLDSVASLARTEVDVIITEEGAADLRGKSVHERAEAICGIASPPARAALQAAWRDISRRL
jgi:acyl-CoA hydrolase